MKFSDKLYNWFYQKPTYKSRTFQNIINGLATGLTVWILSLIVDKFIGLSTFIGYLPHFLVGGMIIGGVIGMISNEVLWHKHHKA